MSRPKGSKNKPQTGKPPRAPKEKAAASSASAPLFDEEPKPAETPAAPVTETAAATPAEPLELQTVEKRDGDVWDGPKLLERVIDYGRDEVGVEIPSDQWQARAIRHQEASVELNVNYPLRASAARKSLRDEKADLLARVLKLGLEVSEHVEKVEVDIEQVADYANDVAYWRTVGTKRRVESEEHPATPLDHKQKQSALPVGDRTQFRTPSAADVAFGSLTWLEAGMPGFEYLPGEKDFWTNIFRIRLTHISRGDPSTDPPTPPRGVLSAKEIDQLAIDGRKALAQMAAEEVAEKAKEAASTGEAQPHEGATATILNPHRSKFFPSEKNESICGECGADDVGHDEDGTCPRKNQAAT